MPQRPTELVGTPHGVGIERLVTGAGEPVTVFAHGLAGDIGGTRPLGSAVSGRRVFFHFRGHGRSDTPPGPWTFADLAADLRAVADLSGATRAVGVSMGAAALCRLLTSQPGRFERIVLYLPAPLDGSGAAATRDRLRRDGAAPQLSGLWDAPAVPDLGALADVTARTLVIGCVGDERHPVAVAERLAAAVAGAELTVYERPDILVGRRRELRERISTFLNRP